jgi:hypothetical protein
VEKKIAKGKRANHRHQRVLHVACNGTGSQPGIGVAALQCTVAAARRGA